MATPHQVAVGDLLYTVVDDCTTTYWAIVTGSVTDEILGALYAPEFTVETGRPDLASKTTASGLFAVTGYPNQSFPQLSSTPYALNLVLKSPGFRDLLVPVTIPKNATFPVVVPPAKLRRLPVRIQGRVVNDLTRAAISGAQVLSVDDPLNPPPPPPHLHTTALRAPLYFDHPLGTQAQNVTWNPPAPLNLTADVAAGDRVLSLLNRSGLAGNDVIQLQNSSQTVVEYAVVDHLGPGTPAAGQVFLRNALNHSYPQSATVAHRTINTLGGLASLFADANAGDGVLLADLLLNGTTTLVVDPGSPTKTNEYHEVGALTDGDGYYGLDGMGRVQEIFLSSKQGALQQTVGWFIEYDNAINVVDLRLA